jgi:hypothetical protein
MVNINSKIVKIHVHFKKNGFISICSMTREIFLCSWIFWCDLLVILIDLTNISGRDVKNGIWFVKEKCLFLARDSSVLSSLTKCVLNTFSKKTLCFFSNVILYSSEVRVCSPTQCVLLSTGVIREMENFQN